MNQVARWNDARRKELFDETAAHMGLRPEVVEKDFWVCVVLGILFEDAAMADKLRFKGGTSLSKAWGLIHRFSEDIDLVLDWRETTDQAPETERSNSSQSRLNEAMNARARAWIAGTLLPFVRSSLPPGCEAITEGVEGDGAHVIAVHYPSAGGRHSYLRPTVRLEVGPLAGWSPWGNADIRPYAAEHFSAVFSRPSCRVPVITAERTFWEKATILHHEAHRPEGSPSPVRYARHYYDLCMMARDAELRRAALADRGLLAQVAQFKMRFYPRAWARYEDAAAGRVRLLPPAHNALALADDYAAMRDMFFAQPPAWGMILSELQQLEVDMRRS